MASNSSPFIVCQADTDAVNITEDESDSLSLAINILAKNKADVENEDIYKDNDEEEFIEKKRSSKRPSPVSSKALSSHGSKWTLEENALFLSALLQAGYGNWAAMSRAMGRTRNDLQIKNRAKHILGYFDHESEIWKELNNAKIESEKKAKMPLATDDLKSFISDNDKVTNFQKEKTTLLFTDLKSFPEQSHITDEEKIAHSDFFQQSSPANCEQTAKTPDLYLYIRNIIILEYTKIAPSYLTAQDVGKIIENFKDTGIIERIHSWLEMNAYINIGHQIVLANSTIECNRINPARNEKGETEEVTESRPHRKRRVKRFDGKWIDKSDISFDPDPSISIEDEQDRLTGNAKSQNHRNTKRRSPRGQDPFRLVKPSEGFCGFSVTVSANAMVVMDFHSHLSHTEIIGLLGGTFVDGTLTISAAYPCESTTSEDIECELDPVSEMDALEYFSKNELSLVGWYHSHPTFCPDPSTRDIENQKAYQNLFRNEHLKIEPFIGAIISPFASNDSSKIQFIHISDQTSLFKNYFVPLQITPIIAPKFADNSIQQCLQKLANQYANCKNRVFLDNIFTDTTTYRQKITQSCLRWVNNCEYFAFFAKIKQSNLDSSFFNEKQPSSNNCILNDI